MAQKRGFAAMSKAKQKEIARKGGLASHKNRGTPTNSTNLGSM